MSIFRSSQKKTSDLNYPKVQPTLNLDFVNNNKLPPFVDFTRNSRTTYFDQNGILQTAGINQPVFEWDPVTKKCLGLRIFGSYNQLLASPQAIGGSGWVNQNSIGVTLNTTDVVDPFGGNTATKLVYGVSNSQTLQTQTLTASQYQSSVFLRTLSGTATINLYVFLAASPFTLIGNLPVTVTTTWQRFNVLTSTATAAAYNVSINMPNSGTTVYAWGANLTVGNVLYPYSPVAGFVAADVPTITGSNFSRFYNQNEGTIYIEAKMSSDLASFPTEATFHDGTNINTIGLYNYISGYYSNIKKESYISDPGIVGILPTTGKLYKKIVCVKINNYRVFVGDLDGASTNPSFIPKVNSLIIGNSFNINASINSTIKKFIYWPQRLPNSIIKNLTK